MSEEKNVNEDLNSDYLKLKDIISNVFTSALNLIR